ncbi:MAG: response regulator [Desulfobacteraceae bacterium]
MRHSLPDYTSSLKGRITLMFVILAVLIEGTMAMYWVYSLRPRIEADIESKIKALAQTQSASIAKALSEEKVNRNMVLKAIDSLFLLKDAETDTPFVSGVELLIDYDAIVVPAGSLDINRWQHSHADDEMQNFYNVEIPLFSSRTKELVGIARFHGSKHSFQYFEKEVRKSFILATLGTMVLLLAVWLVLLSLLNPLRLLAESLSSGHIKDIEPLKTRGRFVSSEIRLVDMKLNELLAKINEYTMEQENLNVILSTQQETSLDGIIVVGDKGDILTYNRRFMDMWGLSADIMNSGSGNYVLVHVRDKIKVPSAFLAQIRYFADNPGEKGFQEIELLDGSIYECYSSPMKGRDEGFFGRVWYFRDISARREAENSLWESEERYRHFLQNFVGVAYQADKDTFEFTMIHGRVRDISGYEEQEILDGKMTLRGLIHTEDIDAVMDDISRLQAGAEYVIDNEYRLCLKDGRIKWIRDICRMVDPGGNKPGFLQGAFYDITKSKNLESQLNQARKMESIGTLAGGIAHDFNNILGIILGNAELIKISLIDGEPVEQFVEEIRVACLRAKKMVEQILVFSRKSDQELLPVSVNQIVDEAVKLIRSTIPSTISISLNLPDKEDIITGDATQMSQVMLNLCANSAHAMRETGGALDITVAGFDTGNETLMQYYDLPDGRYIEIKVSDTGHGINPGIIDRIFDPYFTTKGVGEGSGMGLAVVHGIVTGHEGRIRVESVHGEGTVVRMVFPAVYKQPKKEKEQADTLFSGTEKILIADDEKSITLLLTRLFGRLGYSVTSGTDPVEVYEAFKNDPEGFDLLITDMAMPNMTGADLSRKVKEIRPDMPVILCTGYSDLIDEENAMEYGISRFIMKPLELYDVAETVREILDKK